MRRLWRQIFRETSGINASLGAQHAVQVGVGGPTVLVGTLTILAVAQVGSLFSADAWNNVTFTAGEVKNPSRNLPLSLALGTGVVIALFIACNFIYLSVLPLDGSAAGATILERGIKYATEDRVGTAVMSQMLGATGETLMAIAIMLSGFGCCNGVILAGARVYYAMAKDGLFFKSVAKLHPTYKTPAVSLVVQMIWACILCVSGSYGQLLDYIIFAVLVFYILTIFGLFVLRRTHPDAERPYRAFGYPVLPAIYIVMALFIDVVLLRYKPQYTWPGLIIVLLGIPVYFLWSRRSAETAPGLSNLRENAPSKMVVPQVHLSSKMGGGPVEHSLVTATRSDDRQSERTTVERAQRKTDLRQTGEPRDRQQRKGAAAEDLELGRRRIEPGGDPRGRRQTQHRVVREEAVHVACDCLAPGQCHRHLGGRDSRSPSKALADARSEFRPIAIDPGAMLRVNLSALENAKCCYPFGRVAGVDVYAVRFLDRRRHHFDSRSKRLGDLRIEGRECVRRDQQPSGHECIRGRQQHGSRPAASGSPSVRTSPPCRSSSPAGPRRRLAPGHDWCESHRCRNSLPVCAPTRRSRCRARNQRARPIPRTPTRSTIRRECAREPWD